MKYLILVLFGTISLYSHASVECLKSYSKTEIDDCIDYVYENAVKHMEETPLSEIERNIHNAHPSSYWFYSLGLMLDGQVEKSVFWYYAGLLRYEFYGRTTPGLEMSGERVLYVSMNDMILSTDVFQNIAYSPKSIKIIDLVLQWDDETSNGFTSKELYHYELQQSRQSLTHQKEIISMSKEMKDEVVGL